MILIVLMFSISVSKFRSCFLIDSASTCQGLLVSFQNKIIVLTFFAYNILKEGKRSLEE